MNSTIVILVVAIISVLIIWFVFFVPITNHISIHIDRTTSSKRTDLSKLIITLSIASIVFSVSLMSEQVSNSIYLKYSWFCFLVTIIIGVVMFLLEYIKELSDEIVATHEDGADRNKTWGKGIRRLAHNGIMLNKVVFSLFLAEVVSLILALNFLLIFGTKNL